MKPLDMVATVQLQPFTIHLIASLFSFSFSISTIAHMKSLNSTKTIRLFRPFMSPTTHKDTSYSIPCFGAGNVPSICTAHTHTHTINICILHEAAASRRKKFRFHNSQYKAINIFSVLKDFFFFSHLIPSFWFSLSVAASIRYSIQFFRHIWSLMLVERLKVYFSYYLIRSVFVYVEKT